MSDSEITKDNSRFISKTEQLIRSDLAKNPNEKVLAKPGFFKRKGRKIKKIFSEWWVLGKSGFIMGGIVGSIMGLLGGCVSAYQTKSLIMIPISTIGSACFFASLMSIGACLRSDDNKNMVVFYYAKLNRHNKSNKKFSLNDIEIYNKYDYCNKRI